MATVLRIDPETLPRTLALDPPVTEAEFEEMCRENTGIRLERTKEGTVRMNPPTGGFTGSGNQEIAAQLNNWWRKHENGRLFDSSTGFHLPDGSILSPDASYLSAERLRTLPKGGLRGFPRVCPDFVIELRSRWNSLKAQQEKMQEYLANGTQLAWFIDPRNRRIYIYRPGEEVEVLTEAVTVSADPILAGFELQLAELW